MDEIIDKKRGQSPGRISEGTDFWKQVAVGLKEPQINTENKLEKRKISN